MELECPSCGKPVDATARNCPRCGAPINHPEPPRLDPEPVRRHGWRLTLPNHVRVALEDGAIRIGRESDGITGEVLQLFSQVSREHLLLEVRPETLRVRVDDDKNPVFLYRDGEPTLAQRNRPSVLEPGRIETLQADSGTSLTLCMGQCCFIKIDRGEA